MRCSRQLCCGTLFGLALFLAAGPVEAQSKTKRPHKKPEIPEVDLTGDWCASDGRYLRIDQAGMSVSASINGKAETCPDGNGSRTTYFTAVMQGQGTRLLGTMFHCTQKGDVLQACGCSGIWTTSFTADVTDPYHIVTSFKGEHWDAETKDGKIDPGTCKKSNPGQTVTLTRPQTMTPWEETMNELLDSSPNTFNPFNPLSDAIIQVEQGVGDASNQLPNAPGDAAAAAAAAGKRAGSAIFDLRNGLIDGANSN